MEGSAFVISKYAKHKKGFTLVETIVVVAIVAILAAVLIPIVTRYVFNANKVACEANRATILRLYQVHQVMHQECTLQEFLDGSAPDAPDISKAKCPSGGVYSVDGSKILCSVHDAEEEENNDSQTYSGTSIVIQSSYWPKDSDYAGEGDLITVNPGGVFQYSDGNYYVVNQAVSMDQHQAASGPGGAVYNWFVTQKLTGNIMTFAEGVNDMTVVRGDLCQVGEDYYVFVDGGNVGHPPDVSPGQWYKLPN